MLLELARKAGAGRVYCHGEVTFEEGAAEARVAAALKRHDIALKTLWGSTLHRPEDLPFGIADMPGTHGASAFGLAFCCMRCMPPMHCMHMHGFEFC